MKEIPKQFDVFNFVTGITITRTVPGNPGGAGRLQSMYFRLPRKPTDKAAHSDPRGDDTFFVDYSEDGRPIGIEVNYPGMVSLQDLANLLVSLLSDKMPEIDMRTSTDMVDQKELRKELDEARSDVKRLNGEIITVESQSQEIFSKDAVPGGEGWEAKAKLSGAAVEIMTAALVEAFRGHGATNYLEMKVRDTHPDPTVNLGDFTFTFQRAKGKSPADLATEAVNKMQNAREELKRLIKLWGTYDGDSGSMLTHPEVVGITKHLTTLNHLLDPNS